MREEDEGTGVAILKLQEVLMVEDKPVIMLNTGGYREVKYFIVYIVNHSTTSVS